MSEIKTAHEFLVKQGVKSMSDTFTAFQVERMLDEHASQFKYDFSKGCECGVSRSGETWCCNQCGLPVSKSQEVIKELPTAIITDSEIDIYAQEEFNELYKIYKEDAFSFSAFMSGFKKAIELSKGVVKESQQMQSDAVDFLEWVMEWGDTQENISKTHSELYTEFKKSK